MSAKKDGATIIGVGAAACVACCAGPILGFLAAIGIGTTLGVALFGIAGLAIAGVGALLLVRRRGGRAAACTPAPVSVPLAMPTAQTRNPRMSSPASSTHP